MGRAADMRADIDGTLTFDRVPSATRMRWSVRPKGAASLLAPVINWIAAARSR